MITYLKSAVAKVVALLALSLLTPASAMAADAAKGNLKSDDLVGVTFWVISMALVAATAFFFLETQRVKAKWKTSLTVSGLVTLEDCLEELVGEIIDEHDEETPEVLDLPNGDKIVDGSMSLSDFNDCFRLSLDDDEYDTIGGYLFGTFGHVPTQGETHDTDGWRMKVEELDGRRIRSVRLSPVLDAD